MTHVARRNERHKETRGSILKKKKLKIGRSRTCMMRLGGGRALANGFARQL
jgi:hypothetical protein